MRARQPRRRRRDGRTRCAWPPPRLPRRAEARRGRDRDGVERGGRARSRTRFGDPYASGEFRVAPGDGAGQACPPAAVRARPRVGPAAAAPPAALRLDRRAAGGAARSGGTSPAAASRPPSSWPCKLARPALPRRRGRRRQDRGRQGPRRRPRHRADPPPVLRGPRRPPGRVRVELRAPDDAHPPRGGARRDGGRERELFGPEFLEQRPLLQAIDPARKKAPVLLVDEVDRSDEEFEAYLLEVLSDFQITIPEIGTISAAHPPVVVVTSNRTREVHDALKRRCLYHWIDYPTFDEELAIVRAKVPERLGALARQVTRFVAGAAPRRAVQAARRGRDARLGGGAGGARPQGARPDDRRRHARDPPQVPGRRREGEGRGGRAILDRVRGSGMSGRDFADNLLLFGRVLRGLGLDAGPGPDDRPRAGLEHVSIGRKRDFYHAARALVVHRREDLAALRRAFEVFWRKPAEGAHDARPARARREAPLPPAAVRAASTPAPRRRDAESPTDPGAPRRSVLRRSAHLERRARFSATRTSPSSRAEELEAVRGRDPTARLDDRRAAHAPHARRATAARPRPAPHAAPEPPPRRRDPRVGAPRAPRQKPRPLVVLADISGSMERYTRLLLLFLYALAARLDRRIEVVPLRHAPDAHHPAARGRDPRRGPRRGRRARSPTGPAARASARRSRDFNFHWARRVLGGGAVVLLISDGWDRGRAGAARARDGAPAAELPPARLAQPAAGLARLRAARARDARRPARTSTTFCRCTTSRASKTSRGGSKPSRHAGRRGASSARRRRMKPPTSHERRPPGHRSLARRGRRRSRSRRSSRRGARRPAPPARRWPSTAERADRRLGQRRLRRGRGRRGGPRRRSARGRRGSSTSASRTRRPGPSAWRAAARSTSSSSRSTPKLYVPLRDALAAERPRRRRRSWPVPKRPSARSSLLFADGRLEGDDRRGSRRRGGRRGARGPRGRREPAGPRWRSAELFVEALLPPPTSRPRRRRAHRGRARRAREDPRLPHRRRRSALRLRQPRALPERRPPR